MSKKEFIWPLRVYYEDTDAGGVVYYANYLKFMERARTEWLRQLGYQQDDLLEQKVGFVVRKVDIDYLSPARFNDELEVVCGIAHMGRSSLMFEQTIQCGERVCASAVVTIACVSMKTFKLKSIPDNLKKDFLSVS